MKKQLCVLAVSALASTMAFAEGGYVGFDVSQVMSEFSVDGVPGSFDFEPVALRVKGGGTLNQYFGLEGYLGLGVKDDTVEDTDLEIGIENMLGLDALAILPLGNTAALYGKAGFVSFAYEDDEQDGVRENGFSYGAGAKVNLGAVGLYLEYTVLPDMEDEDVTLETELVSLGVLFNL